MRIISLGAFVLAGLLLIGGCGTVHRFVPTGAQDPAAPVVFSCLGDSVAIAISPPNNDALVTDFSDQFYCGIEIESRLQGGVEIRVQDLSLSLGDETYGFACLNFDERDHKWHAAPLGDQVVILPEDGPPSVMFDPRRTKLDCRTDRVPHQMWTSGSLRGSILVETADGRRAVLPVAVPLTKLSERKPIRWSI